MRFNRVGRSSSGWTTQATSEHSTCNVCGNLHIPYPIYGKHISKSSLRVESPLIFQMLRSKALLLVVIACLISMDLLARLSLMWYYIRGILPLYSWYTQVRCGERDTLLFVDSLHQVVL